MLTLYFNCEHAPIKSRGKEDKQPTCPRCGAELIRVKADQPTFTGIGTSPLKVKHAS